METMVLLKDARTLATPETTFFEPFALLTLIAPSSSLRRSSAVGCLATPCTISTGFCSPAGPAFAEPSAGESAPTAAVGAPSAAGLPPFSPAALGALAFFSPAGAAAPSTGAVSALIGFSFFGADFSSAMLLKGLGRGGGFFGFADAHGLAGALARAGVGARALTADWEAATVANAA